MPEKSFSPHEWALILGGSSGFGLASAHKLSEHGLNLCVVHRDRRGAMSRIDPEFERIRDRGVSLVTFNEDALDAEVRSEILDGLAETAATAIEAAVAAAPARVALPEIKITAPPPPEAEGEEGPKLATIDYEREDERVKRIRVGCPCGESILLDCDFGGE